MGTLPFLAYGVASLVGKADHILGAYFEWGVYALALIGLLVGWLRGFPLWSYGYLGWSITLAYFNSNVKINGVHWGYLVWIPFGAAILVGVLWTRSLKPIKKLCQDIWHDWTRLTLAMFAFGAWAGLIYDEVHHPLLLWFILATTVVVSGGTWFFLRSTRLKGRVFAIIAGFFGAIALNWVCNATWDWYAYHGLPKPEESWFQSWGITLLLIAFWLGILFWPAAIGLIQRITHKRTTS